jgi:transcriptional regulator with PAS, ATPase and Fis domain
MPTIRLTDDAVDLLLTYNFPGNIRQLRNIAEQISVVEESRAINSEKLAHYLPQNRNNLPSVISDNKSNSDFANEREIMYKVLFDMRSDINDLKKLTLDLMKKGDSVDFKEENQHLIDKIYSKNKDENKVEVVYPQNNYPKEKEGNYDFVETVLEDETLSLQDKEFQMIKKSLERNKGKRKLAAQELGISERTLYRKIKQYDL